MFYNATQSLTATNVMTAIKIVNLTASSIAVLATTSRQLWAFARNRGIPFSRWRTPTVLPKDIPLHATLCPSASSFASPSLTSVVVPPLNAIFSLNTAALTTSYLITIGCTILCRLCGKGLLHARFSLGRWGLPINIAAT